MTKHDKSELEILQEFLKKGDTVVVTSLDNIEKIREKAQKD